MKAFGRGPGLAKTRTDPLLRVRTLTLVTGSDARWKALLEAADVVSEGATRGEDPCRVYFGSTDIRLIVSPAEAGYDPALLASLAARDPHLRLRAMRLSRREAAQRADGPLDAVRAEVTVTAASFGVTIHVEIEARVLADRRSAPRPPAVAIDS